MESETEIKMKLPPQVEGIIEKLNTHGYEAFAVGGCVRDVLLGRKPEDWDITTSARPHQVKELFGRTIDTGILHGTVTVMQGHRGYEVTTYRIDGEYEDGRHPKQVAFTGNLLEDLKRRDFTINAMAYSHKTGLIDYFGGVRDLEEGVICCVGDARERFSEDALRILRAIRFSAQLGFAIEPGTREAIAGIAPNIAKVSKERIQAELTKILLSDRPEQIVIVFETGIARYLCEDFERIPWPDVQSFAGLPIRKYARWAGLLRRMTPERTEQILKSLKMDKDTVVKAKMLVSWSGRPIEPYPAQVRHAMSKMPPEIWDVLLDFNRYGEDIRRLTRLIRENGDCLSLKHLAVSGQDLLMAGIKPGRDMGRILETLLDAVLDDPQKNRKDILLDMAREMITFTP